MVQILKLFPLMFVLISSSLWACQSKYYNKLLSREQVIEILSQRNAVNKINLCGSIFDGVDLSHLELENINFNQASFKQTNLTHSNLSRSSFNQADFRQANLSHAYLRWANGHHTNFQEANLRLANVRDTQFKEGQFQRADLNSVDFGHSLLSGSHFHLAKASQVNFSHCDIRHADFRFAQLNQSDIQNTHLTHSDFKEALLQEVNFTNSDLSESHFEHANLSKAILVNTTLLNSDFMQANLKLAVYQPNLNGLPNLISLAHSKHFETIIFWDPHLGAPAITALRNAYKRAGMRPFERKLTAMVKKEQMVHSIQQGGLGMLEGLFNYIFFYLSCDFGQALGRPLLIFVYLVLLFAIPYFGAMRFKLKNSAIFLKWPSRYLEHPTHGTKPLNYFQKKITAINLTKSHSLGQRVRAHTKLIRLSVYFSLLSAFRIGKEDLNIGNWIGQCQKRHYHMYASGWMRVLSGLEALLGAYLIVLWLLIYFGRPFEW